MGRLKNKKLESEEIPSSEPIKKEEIKETSWFDIDARDKKVESKPKKKKVD